MTIGPASTARLLRERAERSDLWVSASGSSMGPKWAPGSRLQLDVPQRSPRPGEVWAFVDREGALIAHRFIRRTRGRKLVFRGDNTDCADQPVPEAWLVGRVTAVDDGQAIWSLRTVDAVRFVSRGLVSGVRRRIWTRFGS